MMVGVVVVVVVAAVAVVVVVVVVGVGGGGWRAGCGWADGGVSGSVRTELRVCRWDRWISLFVYLSFVSLLSLSCLSL